MALVMEFLYSYLQGRHSSHCYAASKKITFSHFKKISFWGLNLGPHRCKACALLQHSRVTSPITPFPAFRKKNSNSMLIWIGFFFIHFFFYTFNTLFFKHNTLLEFSSYLMCWSICFHDVKNHNNYFMLSEVLIVCFAKCLLI